MTHAYDSIYLNKTARNVGNMLHDAVEEFGYSGDTFLGYFVRSDVAKEIEEGNPKFVAGKSGLELFVEVVETTTGKRTDKSVVEAYERSEAYWVGWALAHYQWYSGRSFKEVLDMVSYEDLSGLYNTLHEADIHKVYDVLDKHFENACCNLKKVRNYCGITQEKLAELSGVSLNTIRAYERKSKDINKAQADIVMGLARALKCEMKDLLE